MRINLLAICLIIAIFSFSCSHRAERESALNQLEKSQDKLQFYKTEVVKLTRRVDSCKIEFEVAKDRIARAKEFQFLRTSQERENEIRRKNEDVLNLEQTIESAKNELQSTYDSISINEKKILALREIILK